MNLKHNILVDRRSLGRFKDLVQNFPTVEAWILELATEALLQTGYNNFVTIEVVEYDTEDDYLGAWNGSEECYNLLVAHKVPQTATGDAPCTVYGWWQPRKHTLCIVVAGGDPVFPEII